MIDTSDASKLTAFVQSMQKADDQEEVGFEQQGAPAANVYESRSSDIVETLQDLFVKAESQLQASRKQSRSF